MDQLRFGAPTEGDFMGTVVLIVVVVLVLGPILYWIVRGLTGTLPRE
jgi:hypothetical protein